MKNILKPVIVILIFFSANSAGFSQRRNRPAKQIAPVVVVPDQKQELPIQNNITTFYNIKKYGAKGYSVSIETDAINKAIDAAESNAFDKYQDFGHSHWHKSLICGENLENIAITGG